MIHIGKMLSRFSKVKPLKIQAQSSQHGIKAVSITHTDQWEVSNPLETLLSSLAGCQTATLKALTNHGSLKVKNVKFTRIQSSYNVENFMKGGKDNKINEVFLEAEIETTGTQEDLDNLHKKVVMACPVYQMVSGSGVKINNNWKNIQVSP